MILAAPLILLAGCAMSEPCPPAVGPVLPPATPDECGAALLDRYLNVLPTADIKAAIASAVGDRPVRYIAPGDAVTMDFSPSRLNVETGADGRIKRLRCG